MTSSMTSSIRGCNAAGVVIGDIEVRGMGVETGDGLVASTGLGAIIASPSPGSGQE